MSDDSSKASELEKEIVRLEKEYHRTTSNSERFSIQSRIQRFKEKLRVQKDASALQPLVS